MIPGRMVAVTALVAMMSPDPVEAGVTRTLPKGNLILGCECWLGAHSFAWRVATIMPYVCGMRVSRIDRSDSIVLPVESLDSRVYP